MHMLSHNLPGVHLVLRRDEEAAAVLQVVNGIGVGRAAFERNERTVGAALDVALVRLVFFVAVRHDGLALTGGEHVGTQANDAARGYVELNVHAVAEGNHRGHLALAARHHINHL